MNEGTTQVPEHNLGISINLNVNSAVNMVSNATLTYWALRDYKLSKLKYLISYHRYGLQDEGDFEDAADVWAEINQIETLQEEIAIKAIELSEKNYWKATHAVCPSDYEHIKQGHTECQAKLVADYMEEFKIAISHE